MAVSKRASETLPGIPGDALTAVWSELSAVQRQLLREHILGGTGAKWIADTLKAHGHQIGATAIKDYRARLREAGVQL